MAKVDTQFKKGIIPWNKGKVGVQISTRKGLKLKPLSEETKKKISEAGMGHHRGGWKFSDEAKLKISLGNKGKKRVGHTAWNKDKKCPQTSGEKNGLWKGGVSKGYKTGYYSFEYKNWRKSVFERDEYTCRVCNSMGYITAHHIKSFAHYPELRFELNNGITLCEPCHSLTDNYRGRNKAKGRIIQTNQTLS